MPPYSRGPTRRGRWRLISACDFGDDPGSCVQVLSDGMMHYLNALKVVDTPFPFPYAQLNAGARSRSIGCGLGGDLGVSGISRA